jgi:hypothetical protein
MNDPLSGFNSLCAGTAGSVFVLLLVYFGFAWGCWKTARDTVHVPVLAEEKESCNFHHKNHQVELSLAISDGRELWITNVPNALQMTQTSVGLLTFLDSPDKPPTHKK